MNLLYVAHDHEDPAFMCPGSTVCMAIADKLPDGTVSIQDCDIIKQSNDLPDWLNGTPIFINENEGVPYRGREAVQQLRKLVSSMKTQPKSTPSMSSSSAPIPSDPGTNNDLSKTETYRDAKSDLDDHFRMDVTVTDDEPRREKVTEADLQRYMELRNSSPAAQQPQEGLQK